MRSRAAEYQSFDERKRGPTAAALTATLGLAAVSWLVAVHRMSGMDMGVSTELGSFSFFVTAWVSMMAAAGRGAGGRGAHPDERTCALGVLVVLVPTAVPGLTPAM
jgi:hypothetical protein